MEKKFSQSYSKRENALFTQMKSLRIQKWFNNRWTKMSSDDRFWLIIFSKPSINQGPRDWYLKFWVWDSEKNEIVGENVVEYFFRTEETITEQSPTVPMRKLSEGYLDLDNRRVIFRPYESYCYFIYTFEGILLAQTEKSYDSVRIEEQYDCLSKFLEKNIFFGKAGNRASLYDLSQNNGILPKQMQILCVTGMIPINNDIKVFHDKDLNYLAILADDGNVGLTYQYFNTIWLYEKNSSQFILVSKLSIAVNVESIDVQLKEETLCLSFQYNGVRSTGMPVVMELPLKLFNL